MLSHCKLGTVVAHNVFCPFPFSLSLSRHPSSAYGLLACRLRGADTFFSYNIRIPRAHALGFNISPLRGSPPVSSDVAFRHAIYVRIITHKSCVFCLQRMVKTTVNPEGVTHYSTGREPCVLSHWATNCIGTPQPAGEEAIGRRGVFILHCTPTARYSIFTSICFMIFGACN